MCLTCKLNLLLFEQRYEHAYVQFHSSTCRSEKTKQRESLEKRIGELEGSPENGKKSNSSQRKTYNADKEEIIAEKYEYIILQLTYIVLMYNLLYTH